MLFVSPLRLSLGVLSSEESIYLDSFPWGYWEPIDEGSFDIFSEEFLSKKSPAFFIVDAPWVV